MKKLKGFVLIHPEHQDFVVSLSNDTAIQVLTYSPLPDNALVFKDLDEVQRFVLQIEHADFDVATLSEDDKSYLVEFFNTISSSPNR